ILTTPNPFYAGQSWKIWRYGRPSVHEDHMGWQDPTTLDQLLRRTGFEPFDGYWVQPRQALFKTWKRFFRKSFSHSCMRLAHPDLDGSEFPAHPGGTVASGRGGDGGSSRYFGVAVDRSRGGRSLVFSAAASSESGPGFPGVAGTAAGFGLRVCHFLLP